MLIAMAMLLVALLASLYAMILMDREERRAELRDARMDNARISLGAYRYARQLAAAVAGFPAEPGVALSVADEVGQVLHVAHTVLGSDDAVRAWLARPHPGLGDVPPIVAALRPGGAERVRGVVEQGAAGREAALPRPATERWSHGPGDLGMTG